MQSLLDRYRNPAIRHRTCQIAMDGSQKLPQRLLGTISDRLAAGQCRKGFVSPWPAGCVMSPVPMAGDPTDVRDPISEQQSRGQFGRPVASLLAIGLFSTGRSPAMTPLSSCGRPTPDCGMRAQPPPLPPSLRNSVPATMTASPQNRRSGMSGWRTDPRQLIRTDRRGKNRPECRLPCEARRQHPRPLTMTRTALSRPRWAPASPLTGPPFSAHPRRRR